MIARIQQFTTLIILAGLLAWVVGNLSLGHPWRAGAGTLLVVLAYPGALGIEFALMAWRNRRDPAPRASTAQICAAWCSEVRSGLTVFCWRQPFCSERWANRLENLAPHQRGVVFVHGFACNRGIWNAWLARLDASNTAFIAVNLEPPFDSIDDYVRIIDTAVRRVEATTGLAPVIVAHSMGGLAVRRWRSQQASEPHRVITIGTPHHGTWLARFALSTNGHQMRPGSLWSRALASDEAAIDLAERFHRWTCFYGHCDNIVFPASSATLTGADNRHLVGVAHVRMVDHPEPFRKLKELLEHDE